MSDVMSRQRSGLLAAIAVLSGCAGSQAPPAKQFLANLESLCGQAYAGRIVANEPRAENDPFEGRPLVIHVRSCEASRVLVPFHVGDDRSRTFVLTLSGDRLRLKHDHRHQDGTSDVLTMYGGDSTAADTSVRQTFPVDDESKTLFTREKREVSNTNIWAMEIHPGRMFAYELARPGRMFRVEFDLTQPVPTPPAPWGH
jgi:hypothetical protein